MMAELKSEKPTADFQKKTIWALVWMRLSNEPFIALYALLPFILRKDLNASLLQISILSSLRPILPIFSSYWSIKVTNKRHLLKANLVGAWMLARLPFLLVPWLGNAWYLIFCCGVYELFNKSGQPALIEILKINLPKEYREKIYMLSFVICFLEGIGLGFLLGGLFDRYTSSWQILCGLTALLSISSIFLQLRVPIPASLKLSVDLKESSSESLGQKITKPWKEAYSLLKMYPDFARFQYGFMLGGFSLMLIAPSLTIFFADYLRLNHADFVYARSVLMGAGIIFSSYFWEKFLSRENVPRLTQFILSGFGLYTLFLAFSPFSINWFFSAFFLYGVTQAGSHLLWNLSGTLFVADEDSSPLSRVNVLMLGIRGAIAPALGGWLCSLFGPMPVLIIGSLLCLAGVLYMQFSSSKKAIHEGIGG